MRRTQVEREIHRPVSPVPGLHPQGADVTLALPEHIEGSQGIDNIGILPADNVRTGFHAFPFAGGEQDGPEYEE